MKPPLHGSIAMPELLAACWTSAGHVVPFRGIATSPVDVGVLSCFAEADRRLTQASS